ncbi:MAG: hypothetical protein WCL23_02090 [Candidatus Moraniibacteriota bacterium]
MTDKKKDVDTARWCDVVEAARILLAEDQTFVGVRIFVLDDLGVIMKAVEGFPNGRFRICSSSSALFPYHYSTDMDRTEGMNSRFIDFVMIAQKKVLNEGKRECGFVDQDKETISIVPNSFWETALQRLGSFQKRQEEAGIKFDRIVLLTAIDSEEMIKDLPDFPVDEFFDFCVCRRYIYSSQNREKEKK